MTKDPYLSKYLKRFRDQTVATVGDIMLDEYEFGIPRLSAESDAQTLTGVGEPEYRLGGAANVAHNIASLGGISHLFGNLGKERLNYAAIVRELCRNAKINLTAAEGGRTVVKRRTMGYNHNTPLFRFDKGEKELLNGKVIGMPEMTQEMEDLLFEGVANLEPDAIVLSGYYKTVLKGKLGARIVERYGGKIPIIVDAKKEELVKIRGATVVKVNRLEAQNMVGDSSLDEEGLVRRLKEMTESQYAIVTLSDKGMIAYDGGFHKVPTVARQVADVTGAGDSVAAAIALSLATGARIEEAMFIGNLVAGIKVENRGTYAVSIDELINRLELQ